MLDSFGGSDSTFTLERPTFRGKFRQLFKARGVEAGAVLCRRFEWLRLGVAVKNGRESWLPAPTSSPLSHDIALYMLERPRFIAQKLQISAQNRRKRALFRPKQPYFGEKCNRSCRIRVFGSKIAYVIQTALRITIEQLQQKLQPERAGFRDEVRQPLKARMCPGEVK